MSRIFMAPEYHLPRKRNPCACGVYRASYPPSRLASILSDDLDLVNDRSLCLNI
jgi:hypothetical protein